MTRESLLTSRVLAVLGPTNTGKTHFAVERMLAHESGMIGFPLRLLAREIYDRIVALKGADKVALFTGEEKIGREGAPYVVATVEAMPLSREVAFMAVDEIQLCADRERGHIFTDRLLNARGYAETVFLGSDTIRPLLKELIPRAEIVTRPRFSILSYTGPQKLHRLPRRSAIVAFSATDVYTLAEAVRRQKGGTAVVLGALSPRTRNAQVELFQSGEVEQLVATDAIGMGLNMDLAHVAFADLTKFDGVERRALTPPEIGQIAGRAGRHMADGTFGTTNACGEIDAKVVEAVENHTFAPLKRLRWRSSDLDFRSLERLSASLDQTPSHAGLVKVRDALDDRSLGALARRDEVRAKASGEARVRLLWQVCQIPDFRKTLSDAHVHLLHAVYRFLTEGKGRLPNDWMGRMLAAVDRVDGDIETLVGRIAHTRTLTYLAHRETWLVDPGHWQGQTRSVEDRLSDALHERLTQKFVDRRTAILMRTLHEKGELDASVDPDGVVVADGEAVGRMRGLVFSLDERPEGADGRLLAAAARRAAAGALARVAGELVQAPDAAFAVEGFEVRYGGAPVARLGRGDAALRLKVTLVKSDELPERAAAAVGERLERLVGAWLDRRVGPLRALASAAAGAELPGAARGVAYRLVEGLGTVPRGEVEDGIAGLNDAGRKALARLGVRFGLIRLYLPALLKPAAIEALALLYALKTNAGPVLPPPGRTVLRGGEIADPAWAEALGFVPLDALALRVDVAERLAAALRGLARSNDPGAAQAFPADLAAGAGLKRDELLAVMPALGFKARLDGEGLRLARRRPERKRPPAARKAAAMRGGDASPFAVLAGLKVAL